MKLSGSEKQILETLFDMRGGYVLDFSNRTMEAFFQENFEIEIYSPKYDREDLSASKANRLRAIWEEEDDQTVGKIILALLEHMEFNALMKGEEISKQNLLLAQKAKEIASKLVAHSNATSFKVEESKSITKRAAVKHFTALDITTFTVEKKIYFLRLLFSYFEAALNAYYGRGLFFLTSGIDELNVSYKVLRRKMAEVIESEPSFADLKKSEAFQGVIEPITSLYIAPSFLDGVWEDHIQKYLVDFREMVLDKDLFENNSQMHPFETCVPVLLDVMSEEIEELNEILSDKEKKLFPPGKKSNFFDEFLGEDRGNKKENNQEPQEPIIKHEHRHIFENSIQEKEIAVSVDDKRNTSKAEHKFPHKLPRGTKWQNITIKFSDDDTVQIFAQGKSHTAHYREMGLEGKGGKPSVLWIFLRVLAKYSGEIKATDPEAVDTYKKQKQLLSKALESYFGIDFDPFHPFQANKSYQVKFVLLPPEGGFSFEKKRKSSPLEKPVNIDPFADLGSYMEDVAPIVAQEETVPKENW